MESSSGVGGVHCCAGAQTAKRETEAERRERQRRRQLEERCIDFFLPVDLLIFVDDSAL
jgi:hypothetical protein